jgi:hypothetical protein
MQQFLFSSIAFFSLVLHLVCQRALGRVVIRFVTYGNSARPQSWAVEYAVGLLVYLFSLLIMLSLGVPWWAATYLPYLCTFWRESSENYRVELPKSGNHLFWLFVQIVLGLSLLDGTGFTYTTAWRNGYGDYAYHLGMISSFAIGDLFPPTQVIFAGEPLSYPFFVNLWSASLWWMAPTPFLLSLVFLYQWVVLWELVYHGLDGDRSPFLPWVLLLGGGSYAVLGENSGEQIREGYPFSSFLTTIWIPQRTSVFGAAIGSVVLSLWFAWERSQEKHSALLVCAGLLLGLSPLVHTHIMLVIGLFVLLSLLVELLLARGEEWKEVRSGVLQFCGFSLLSLHAIPFLLGKESLVSVTFAGFFSRSVVNSPDFLELFLWNLGPLVVFFFVGWVLVRRHRDFLVLSFLMFVAWTVRIAVWEWDQVKLFVALYLILLAVIGRDAKRIRFGWFLFIPLLVIPTLVEIGACFQQGGRFEIFSKRAVEFAEEIDKAVPRDAIVLAAPDHNSPVLLSGRRLFAGYDGWLWSHAIDYKDRRALSKDLQKIAHCRGSLCPRYLVWGESAEKFWKRAVPPQGQYEKVAENIYRVGK